MILKLPIKKKWFDMIYSREKTDEYRDVKDYWMNIMTDEYGVFKNYDFVKFTNGYGNHRPAFIIRCKKVTIGWGKKEWGAKIAVDYIRISLGEVVETFNIPV